MADIQSFAYIADPDARVLILGSVPGVRSLQAVQYYAHPRNAFWPIMAELLGFSPELPYTQRLAQLRQQRVALWDVVHRCHRPGSLDQNIAPDSVEANDFAGFFARHLQLQAVFFNGGTAETLFRRHVLRAGIAVPGSVRLQRLPSTSPANASVRQAQKLESWRILLNYLQDNRQAKRLQPP